MIVLPNKSARVWNKFLQENEILIYKFIVREVEKNLESEHDRIDLFKFEDGSMHAWLPKKRIPDTLTQAIKLFVKVEEYEYADKATRVMNQFYINKLISEV